MVREPVRKSGTSFSYIYERRRSTNMNRLIRLNEVMNLTALSRSAIYRKMKTGEFPQSVNIGDRAVAWVEQDIKEWIVSVIERGSDDNRR